LALDCVKKFTARAVNRCDERKMAARSGLAASRVRDKAVKETT
jgi:hypothetical protein